jgi:hypothetical protein
MDKTIDSKLWRTADGEFLPITELTQQHLSNIYWYHLVFQEIKGMPVASMKNHVQFSKEEIDKRFEGVILEWRPVFDFEIRWLKELGMLTGGTVISDKSGKKIGNILTTPVKEVPTITY